MANVQFQNATFTRRVCVGKIQAAENIRISVKNEIQQVLSVGVESVVSSYDATAGDATFYGKTNIKFLYFDGTALCSSNYNADFTANIQSELISADSKLTFDVVTIDKKVDTNANTATLSILLEITCHCYASASAPYLESCEDGFVKNESCEILQSADTVTLPTVIDQELNSSKNISTVLLAESSLVTTDYTILDGVLRIKGEACVRLTYLSDGELTTDALPFGFERELDATDILSDAQLRISILPKNTKVRLDISDEVNTAFTVEIAAHVRVEAEKVGVLQIVSDAYCENCDFVFERRTVSTTLPCGSAVVCKTTSATLPLEHGKTPLVIVNAGAIVTKCVSGEKSATVDGVVYGTMLYSTEQGYDVEELELPFSQVVDVDYLAPQCKSYATATVCSFTAREANGLQTEAELRISIEAERQVDYQVIIDATEKPFDKKQLPAIEICLAHRGETLWNLAKNLHMSQEDLIAVNPEITNPLQQDARIVVYNKITN